VADRASTWEGVGLSTEGITHFVFSEVSVHVLESDGGFGADSRACAVAGSEPIGHIVTQSVTMRRRSGVVPMLKRRLMGPAESGPVLKRPRSSVSRVARPPG
jgi:hypothetical protein